MHAVETEKYHHTALSTWLTKSIIIMKKNQSLSFSETCNPYKICITGKLLEINEQRAVC